MNYANTQTERDLHDAFMDEAAAHVKYKLFSRQAAEEGLGEIADEYDRIAGEELGHAEMWLRELGGISDTQNNLKQTIRGEMADYKTSYPNFAHNAHGEGFDELADRFSMTGAVEEGHSRLFADMLDRLESGGYGGAAEDIDWRCATADMSPRSSRCRPSPALRLQQPVYAAGYVPKLKKRELTPGGARKPRRRGQSFCSVRDGKALLGASDFPGTQTAGADADRLVAAADVGLDLSDVGLPGPAGLSVRVGNVVAERDALAANRALCHVYALRFEYCVVKSQQLNIYYFSAFVKTFLRFCRFLCASVQYGRGRDTKKQEAA